MLNPLRWRGERNNAPDAPAQRVGLPDEHRESLDVGSASVVQAMVQQTKASSGKRFAFSSMVLLVLPPA